MSKDHLSLPPRGVSAISAHLRSAGEPLRGQRVFMDVDKIPFGTDFREHIRKFPASKRHPARGQSAPNWLGQSAD